MNSINNNNFPQIYNPMFLGGYQKKKWSCEENKLFEIALAEFNTDSPSFFENVMSILPWKTIDEIKSRYEELIEGILSIEAQNFSSNLHVQHDNINSIEASDENKRKGVPWTEEEHRSFLKGLQKCGKGEWRLISIYYVPSKTASQVASHAQKYFRRLKCKTPLERRRHSIHDIRMLNNSTIVHTAPRRPNYLANYTSILINRDPPAPLQLPANHNANYTIGLVNQDPLVSLPDHHANYGVGLFNQGPLVSLPDNHANYGSGLINQDPIEPLPDHNANHDSFVSFPNDLINQDPLPPLPEQLTNYTTELINQDTLPPLPEELTNYTTELVNQDPFPNVDPMSSEMSPFGSFNNINNYKYDYNYGYGYGYGYGNGENNVSVENAASNSGSNNVEVMTYGENNVMSNELYSYDDQYLSTPCHWFTQATQMPFLLD